MTAAQKPLTNRLLLASVLTICAVLDSGCNLPDTVRLAVAGFCERTEVLVTSTEDPRGGLCSPSNCSLRQAITLSNACTGIQTIRIPSGTYVLTIPDRGAWEDANAAGDLDILQSVTLIGEGMPVIDGNHASGIFHILSDATVELGGMTIQNGYGQQGLLNYGTLIANGLLIQNNAGVYGSGGGLVNAGTASISHSAIVNNDGSDEVYSGGGVTNSGMLTLDNTTISGNLGCGLLNVSGQVDIHYSTFAYNDPHCEIGNPRRAASVWISNSIIAGHADAASIPAPGISGGGADTVGNCWGELTSKGFNLDNAPTTRYSCGLSQASDLLTIDPGLIPLAAYGDSTPVLALDPSSPAINSANSHECGVSDPFGHSDQRGVARPQGPACDRGAYELESAPSSPTPTPFSGVIPLPSDTPTITPTAEKGAGSGAVTIESLSTDTVYLGNKKCGPLEVTITARATAPNPIQVVVLFYDFGSGTFQDIAMSPIGGDLFQRTLNPTSLLGGSVPFDESTLVYQVVVQQQGGDTSIRTPVLSDIGLLACGGTTGGGEDCPSYSAKKACESHGCNWVASPGNVPFVCQNP